MTERWDELASRIGLSEEEARRKAELLHGATSALLDLRRSSGLSTLDVSPIAHWVPGRVEFLGKHTDYAGGRSLLCTVERGMCVVAHPRDDGRVRVRAAASGATVECALDPSADTPMDVDWATYPATVARRIARNFTGPLRGADVVFVSDLPAAAGLSSSSALVVAIYLSLSATNRLEERDEYRRNIRTTEDLAEFLGCIENGFDFRDLPGDAGVGTLSGCEDQTAMLCARPRALVQYSFCPVRFERTVPLPPGHTLAIASSGLRAEKTGSALEKYNVLSRQARAVGDVWRSATGRADATIADAVASGRSATAELRRYVEESSAGGFSSADLSDRLEQFIAESEIIIPAAGDALARGDLAALGALVDRSVDGATRLLRNQVPETLALTSLARDYGAVAASPFGAGFGGSVWSLIKEEEGNAILASQFIERWRSAYVGRFPEREAIAEFFLTRAGPPASRIS